MIQTLEGVEITENAKFAKEFAHLKAPETQAVVDELIQRDHDRVARRVASCGHEFSCGKPRLCHQCTSAWQLPESYETKAVSWERPSHAFLKDGTLYDSPIDARQAVTDGFASLRRRKFPVGEAWIEQLAKKDVEFASKIQSQYLAAGRWMPFSEIMSAGLGGVHVEEHRGSYRAHVDLVANSRYIPWDTLRETWDKCIDGIGKAGITRMDAHDGDSRNEAIRRTLGYVTEKVDIANPEKRVEYWEGASGKHTHIPFGNLA